MESTKERTKVLEPVLVTGGGRMACGISACLSAAGHPVTLHSPYPARDGKWVGEHLEDLAASGLRPFGTVEMIDAIDDCSGYRLVVALAEERTEEKRSMMRDLEERVDPDALLAVNTESIPLSVLQEGRRFPGRILGVNWTEPAHTTLFLELVTNAATEPAAAAHLLELASSHWRKDPYVAAGGFSIRSRIFSAMAREAFYLVQNGYASVEDVDRACRNDAGYYLPFAGNCRYMDLMGTYAYGVVMGELNPDLASDSEVPAFFRRLVAEGALGMENGRGFYTYDPGDRKRWEKLSRTFSFQVRRLMEKYPFNYKKERSEKTTGSHED